MAICQIERPRPGAFVVTSPTGRRVRINLEAICGWEDRPLVAKLQQDTVDLTIAEMEVVRRNGFVLKN